MLNKLYILIVGFLFILSLSTAQESVMISADLQWDQSRLISREGPVMSIPWDEKLSLNPNETLPYFSHSFRWTETDEIRKVHIREWEARWKTMPLPEAWQNSSIPSGDSWTVSLNRSGNRLFLDIRGIPFKEITDSTITFATGISWEITYGMDPQVSSRDVSFKNESVLRSGTYYKIRIPESGIYRLDQAFFEEVIGINTATIDPHAVQLYAGEAGMLPEAISKERIDDLEEFPLWFSAPGNGFSGNDYFLFYAQGPSPWIPDNGYNWKKPINIYDNYQYLYLRMDGSNGKRIETRESLSSTAYQTDIYLDHARYEVDKVNLLGEFISGEGSGQQWFGDIFTNSRQKDYSDYFGWDGLIPDSSLRVKGEFAGRIGEGNIATVRLNVNGQIINKQLSGVEIDQPLATYARSVHFNENIPAAQEQLDIRLEYPQTVAYSEGWLDYLQVEGYRRLDWDGEPMVFSHPKTSEFPTAEFELSGISGNLSVWDITDSRQIHAIEPNGSGSTRSIGFETGFQSRRFIAFDEAKPVEWSEEMKNQNIHSMAEAEMLIIYHPQFEEQALRLRDHRIAMSGLDVRVVSTELIYNEYSSGKADPSAIRNFVKMIYDRSPDFKYLLLFGDASYDYRGIDKDMNYENFVPTYETRRSLYPISSYPTDDYFALLNDSEGGNLRGALDIAVGRLPITSEDEAENLVDKILRYETEQSTFGPWRLNLGFSADDGDSNRHFYQAEDIATEAAMNYPVFNNKKYYLDAYPRVSTPGGTRFPEANQAINQGIFKGLLVFNYLGHGGPSGLTQERVLTTNDISDWENKNKLPLFITATCTFSPFDDPASNSGGEMVLHNRNGGGIALFSTVRAVYSGSNKRLNDEVYSRLFKRYEGDVNTLGEIMMNSKNANSADTTDDNARKFALLGDPSLQLAVPKYDIALTEINGDDELYPLKDTLNALEKVTVQGEIRDHDGQVIRDFSGQVFATVFDKAQTKQTLGQSGDSSPSEFTVQNSVMFKGNATVTDGVFSFSFVIPQDIDYDLGQGKISLYAYDGQATDAGGYYDQFIVGGSADSVIDDQAPLVRVFMNTTDFKTGGITNETPTLYALIEDDRGINVTGNSIGHDMVAILDGEEEKKYVLNDYFQSDLDDYTSGSVRYPLGPLEEGVHEIEVRAYDIANNVGIGKTSFVVVNDANELIDHILNYPNPFASNTYFEIGHNLPPGPVQLDIQIFNNTGQLVTTMQYDMNTEGYLIKAGPWDGSSHDGGGELANGMYFYRVIMSRDTEEGSSVELISDTKKLILLK